MEVCVPRVGTLLGLPAIACTFAQRLHFINRVHRKPDFAAMVRCDVNAIVPTGVNIRPGSTLNLNRMKGAGKVTFFGLWPISNEKITASVSILPYEWGTEAKTPFPRLVAGRSPTVDCY